MGESGAIGDNGFPVTDSFKAIPDQGWYLDETVVFVTHENFQQISLGFGPGSIVVENELDVPADYGVV